MQGSFRTRGREHVLLSSAPLSQTYFSHHTRAHTRPEDGVCHKARIWRSLPPPNHNSYGLHILEAESLLSSTFALEQVVPLSPSRPREVMLLIASPCHSSYSVPSLRHAWLLVMCLFSSDETIAVNIRPLCFTTRIPIISVSPSLRTRNIMILLT